jgi:transposase
LLQWHGARSSGSKRAATANQPADRPGVVKVPAAAYLGHRLKQFRRIASHYDKRAVNYLAWVTLAAAAIWL